MRIPHYIRNRDSLLRICIDVDFTTILVHNNDMAEKLVSVSRSIEVGISKSCGEVGYGNPKK